MRRTLRRGLSAFILGTGLLPLGGTAGGAEPFFAHEQPRYRSGDQLLEDCRSLEPQAQGRCAGYIMAVADMLGGASARIDGIEACLRGDESLAELLQVVLAHLEANPARASLKGDGAVAYALSIYRPCEVPEDSFTDRVLNR